MKHRLLVSSGAIVSRYCDRDFSKFAELAPSIEADGFEFMMLTAYYGKFDEIINKTRKSGLHFDAFHIEKEIGMLLARGEGDDRQTAMALLADNLRFAAALGVSLCVFHLWGGAVSDSRFRNCLSALPEVFALASKYPFTLTIENVPCTTATPYRRLLQLKALFPNIRFTLDLRFAAFHREEKLFLSDNALVRENVRHLHVSDLSAESRNQRDLRPIVHPGEGCAEFPLLYDFLKKTDLYRGFITVESPVFLPECRFDVPKLNRTLSLLRKNLS